MISKAQIKHLNSLKLLRFRKANGEFVVEGEKMVHELIMSNSEIIALYAVPGWLEVNQKLISSKEIHAEKVSPKELERISSFKTPNQVLAFAKTPTTKKINFEDLILVLDDIRDPGNLGTIIRTADWFGIKNVLCSPTTVDLYNPKVIQASMGSFIRMNVVYEDLDHIIQTAKEKELKIYGTLLNGDNIYSQKLDNKGLIVIGNESRGISENIKKLITHCISIPAHSNSKAESLNASVATAIICAEFRRKKA